VVIEGGADGRGAVARITWESVAAATPRAVTAVLDGQPVQVSNPRRVELPPFDPEQLHFLRVELEFTDIVSAVAEATFGGVYQDASRTELTALPVVPVEGAPRTLRAEDLEGWFATVAGEPLPPVAVEDGPGEVVFVLDGAAQREIWKLGWTISLLGARDSIGPIPTHPPPPGAPRDRMPIGAGRPNLSKLRYDLQLGKGQALHLLWPVAEAGAARGDRPAAELFPRAEDHPPGDGGVLWLLSEATQPAMSLADQRLVDAVAVAGMTATLRARRRAVVLVLSEHPADASRLRPANVRSYLEQLGVPLYVWVFGKVSEPMRQAWGERVRSVDARHRLAAAVREVSTAVGRQRIVWFDGQYLPQEIVVTGRAKVRRAR